MQLGGAEWFRLGDHDLATCLLRTELLHEGMRLTEIARALADALDGVDAAVLPMCDEPVQTYVRTEGEWRHFQEYLILQHSEPPLEGVEFRGAEQAQLDGEVRRAIEEAEAIVIGPSNPIASIGPILAVPGMREALAGADAPVVAVSPLVGGPLAEGADRGVHALGRAARSTTAASPATTPASRPGWSWTAARRPAGRRTAGVVLRQTDTLMADAARPRAARERGARVRRWRSAARRIVLPSAVATAAILPVKRFAHAKQRLGDRSRVRHARGARGGDGRRRARRARHARRCGPIVVVSGEPRCQRPIEPW